MGLPLLLSLVAQLTMKELKECGMTFGGQQCRNSITFFYEMESCNMLNPLNETDIYCLHYTFLPRISSILDSFASGWNNHKLSTEGNRSPNQLFIQGLLDFDNESQSSTAQPLPNPSVPHATAATSSSISTSPAMHTTQGSSNQSTSNNQDLYAQDCVEVPRSRFSPCQVIYMYVCTFNYNQPRSRSVRMTKICNHSSQVLTVHSDMK